MWKRFEILGLLLVATLALATTEVSATFVNVTYTGDNIVRSWFQNGGSPVEYSPGPNASDWRFADSEVLSLGTGAYQVIFRVTNLGGPQGGGAGNPGGFLAEISGAGASGALVSSTQWDYAHGSGPDPSDFNTLAWTSATSWGTNGGTNIWTTNRGGPITGISTSADWIWSENNFVQNTDADLYLRGRFDVVPEPMSVSFLGLGLLGMGLIRRRQKS